MLRVLVLGSCVAAALIVAGCAGQTSGGGATTSNAGRSSGPTSNNSTSNATLAPRAPVEVFNGTFEFGASAPPAQTMTVADACKYLDFFVSVRARQASVPVVLEPEQGSNKPYILFKAPTGPATKKEIDAVVQSTTGAANSEIKRFTGAVSAPPLGGWSIEAHGVGNNANAWIVAKEVFG